MGAGGGEGVIQLICLVGIPVSLSKNLSSVVAVLQLEKPVSVGFKDLVQCTLAECCLAAPWLWILLESLAVVLGESCNGAWFLSCRVPQVQGSSVVGFLSCRVPQVQGSSGVRFLRCRVPQVQGSSKKFFPNSSSLAKKFKDFLFQREKSVSKLQPNEINSPKTPVHTQLKHTSIAPI